MDLHIKKAQYLPKS